MGPLPPQTRLNSPNEDDTELRVKHFEHPSFDQLLVNISKQRCELLILQEFGDDVVGITKYYFRNAFEGITVIKVYLIFEIKQVK